MVKRKRWVRDELREKYGDQYENILHPPVFPQNVVSREEERKRTRIYEEWERKYSADYRRLQQAMKDEKYIGRDLRLPDVSDSWRQMEQKVPKRVKPGISIKEWIDDERRMQERLKEQRFKKYRVYREPAGNPKTKVQVEPEPESHLSKFFERANQAIDAANTGVTMLTKAKNAYETGKKTYATLKRIVSPLLNKENELEPEPDEEPEVPDEEYPEIEPQVPEEDYQEDQDEWFDVDEIV